LTPLDEGMGPFTPRAEASDGGGGPFTPRRAWCMVTAVPVRYVSQSPALAAAVIAPKYAPEPRFRGFRSTIMRGPDTALIPRGLMWLLMRTTRAVPEMPRRAAHPQSRAP